MRERTLVTAVSGSINQCEISWRSVDFWHQDLTPSNNLRAPELQSLRPHNHQDRWPNAYWSSQPHQNTPRHDPVHQRDKAQLTLREGRHQSHSPRSLHSPWTYILTRKRTSERGGTMVLWPMGTEATNTERQNETTEMCFKQRNKTKPTRNS